MQPEHDPFLAALDAKLAGTQFAAAPSSLSAPPADLGQVTDRIAQLEGTGQNPRSSSRGVGQFTDATWLGTYRRHAGGQGMSDAQVLALRDDPATARAMLNNLVSDNAQALASAGHEATPGAIYLANHFGAAGANAILRADPSTPLERIVGPDVMRANPQLAGQTAGGIAETLANRMEGQPASSAPTMPIVAQADDPNDPFLAALNARIAGGFPAAPVPPQLASAPNTGTSAPLPTPRPSESWAQSIGHGLNDAGVGALRGVTDVLGTGAWLADKGLGTHWQDATDRAQGDLAADQYRPDGWAAAAGRLGGDLFATAPVAELKMAQALGASGKLAVAARVADVAVQGGAAGALASGGHDVPGQLLTGAVAAPVIGAAAEHVALPLALRGYDAAKGSKLAQALRDFRDVGPNASLARQLAAADTPLPGWSAEEIAQGWRRGADGATEFLPAKAPARGAGADGSRDATGRLVVNVTPADAPAAPGVSDDMKSLAAALDGKAIGSRGARMGIEANTDFPPEVQQHVAQLTAQGVPTDQALREAEMVAVGAKPTLAHVTRNPLDQRALHEGMKMDSPEGQAISAQVSQNNAALHDAIQQQIAAQGGVPMAGEASETAAKSLARASDAERQKVSRLYDLAAMEHGLTGPEAIEPNINGTSNLAPHYNDRPIKVDAPDERDELSPSRVANANGKMVSRRGPMDLVTFLRSKGGIQDQSGELAHAGIDNKPRDLDFARNEGFLGALVRPNGMTFDDAAEMAHEAGFFPNHYERPTVREFLEALQKTHRGGSYRAFRPDDLNEIDRFERAHDARYEAEQRAAGIIHEDDTKPFTETDFDQYHVPDDAYLADFDKMGGTVSAAPLYKMLDETEMRAPFTGEGRSLTAGFRRALGALSRNGGKGMTPSELEQLRKMVNGAYDPFAAPEPHRLGGRMKEGIDQLFDELGDASPAYKKARTAHQEWARRYDTPEGVFRLIRRDPDGNFKEADSWRQADGMMTKLRDAPFIQVVRQLQENGDDRALSRLKASVIQQAYEHATGARGGTAVDQAGNSQVSGKMFLAKLDEIGLPKLQALFSRAELGKLATIGRAANHLNEAVPGTVNTSGTSSALLNALKRMGGSKDKSLKNMAADAGLLFGGQALGHAILPGLGGTAVGFVGNIAKAALERGRVNSAGREAAQHIRELATPEEGRAAEKAAAARLAEALRRADAARAAAPHIGRAAALANALSQRGGQEQMKGDALANALRQAGAAR